jgi:alcohol dehydrogenase
MSRDPSKVQTDRFTVDFDGTRMVCGTNALEQLGSVVTELGCRRILLVTDAGVRATGHVDRAIAALQTEEIDVTVFDEVDPNPTTKHVKDGVRAAAGREVDGIIGLGGGSPMDCAKGINFLLTNGGEMEDYWGVNKATQPMLPSVGVPTTAGTGSDAQSFALISQEGSRAKMACGDRKAKFAAVILDPSLPATLPRELVAINGFDAVSHVVESYVSLRRNPLSQMLAREAWRLLDGDFEIVLEQADEPAWGRMLLGAHLAGASIEHSMLGAAHACANPLTARFDVPHGAAVGLTLPQVMRYNEAAVGELYDDLRPGSTAEGSLVERIEFLRRCGGLPESLGDYAIPRDCLPELADEASHQWTAGFNPRPVTSRELLAFYEAAY